MKIYWMKYRRGTSASKGHWEWMIILATSIEDAQHDATEMISEMDQSYYWSEHHRGHEWEVLESAPDWVVDEHIRSVKSRIESLKLQEAILSDQLPTSKPCGCAGRTYCDQCGRLVQR